MPPEKRPIRIASIPRNLLVVPSASLGIALGGHNFLRLTGTLATPEIVPIEAAAAKNRSIANVADAAAEGVGEFQLPVGLSTPMQPES